MAKGKYQEWISDPDKRLLLSGWARDGLTDDKIAEKIGISRSTLAEWKKKYPDISDALKKGKEIVDTEVENSLYKRAMGYTVQVAKNFKCKLVEYDPETGKRIKEEEKLVVGYDEVHIPADVTAIIFFLKNRLPEKWKDRRMEIPEEISENTGVIVLAETVAENLEEAAGTNEAE